MILIKENDYNEGRLSQKKCFWLLLFYQMSNFVEDK